MMRRSRSRVSMGLRLVLLVAAIYLTAACNVVSHRQERIEDGLRAEGLVRKVDRLGVDTVEYWVGGQGPDLLLLHGFGASAVWQWSEQIPAFVRDHRVIVPNLLWFGESCSAVEDYSLDHQVAAVVALLDSLDSQSVTAVGLSYGGLVAFELAARYPDRVSALVLSDSPGREYRKTDYDAACDRFGVERLASLLVPDSRQGVQHLMDLGYRDPPWVPGFVKDQVLTVLYGTYRSQKMGLLDTIVEDWSVPVGPDPDVPTLLIWGDGDTVFPLEIAQRLQARLGGMTKLQIIENARHAPNLEHPAIFNRLIGEFLAEQEP